MADLELLRDGLTEWGSVSFPMSDMTCSEKQLLIRLQERWGNSYRRIIFILQKKSSTFPSRRYIKHLYEIATLLCLCCCFFFLSWDGIAAWANQEAARRVQGCGARVSDSNRSCNMHWEKCIILNKSRRSRATFFSPRITFGVLTTRTAPQIFLLPILMRSTPEDQIIWSESGYDWRNDISWSSSRFDGLLGWLNSLSRLYERLRNFHSTIIRLDCLCLRGYLWRRVIKRITLIFALMHEVRNET